MTHYESWVVWRKGTSDTDFGLKEDPLDRCTLGRGIWVISSTHPLVKIATQGEFIVTIYHPRSLSELHPPSHALLLLSCPWALASLMLGGVYLSLPLFSLTFSLPHLALARSPTALSPILLKAGTTFRSSRKPFNRSRLISHFSSLPLEAA